MTKFALAAENPLTVMLYLDFNNLCHSQSPNMEKLERSEYAWLLVTWSSRLISLLQPIALLFPIIITGLVEVLSLQRTEAGNKAI